MVSDPNLDAGRVVLRLRTFGGLSIEGVDGTRLPNPRPRRLGLLAILAVAGPRGISRNRLRAIFWPDSDDEPARHALSQTIYALRRDLGVRAIIAETDLRLDPENISSDAEDFRAALARSDWAAVRTLYQGPFAAGFSLDDSPEFERWLDQIRLELARKAEGAIETLAREAETSGDLPKAAEAWKQLAGLDPLSARYAASYMSALAALGDRAGAIAHANQYTTQVRRELEAEPDPVVTTLVAQLRAAGPGPDATPGRLTRHGADSIPTVVGPASGSPASVVEAPPRAARTWWARRMILGGSTIGLLVVIGAAIWASLAKGSPTPAPILAVGQLRDLTAPDPTRRDGVLGEVLATSLARLAQVEVIANSRILELVAHGRDTVRSARTDAARRAGATEILEGELVPAVNGQLRLDLRRIEIARGTVRGGYSVSGTDPFGLIDSATALVAADLRVDRPHRALADLTTRSPTALRLYDEGLRAYFRAEPDLALRMFREALAEDSTFAMAAYYAYRTQTDRQGPDPALEALALRLADNAPDRDRLIIRTSIGLAQADLRAPLYADSLVARFPRDPEALIRAAEASSFHQLIGPRERGMLERAIAIDSAADPNPNAPCRLCHALGALIGQLQFADSGPAAEQAIRRFIRFQPTMASGYVALGLQQFGRGQYEAAMTTVAKAANLIPDPGSDVPYLFVGRLLSGHLDEADEECAIQLRHGDREIVGRYRWLCEILWRNQGRYQAASALLFSGRLPDGGQLSVRLEPDLVSAMVLDLEMGRPTAALRLLESVIPTATGLTPGRFAREMTWNLTRRATAAVMALEYDLARRLADSAEAIGKQSLFGRDPLLHFFIRGLIAQSANDHQTAVDFFRRSIFSWNFGYTRANLALAKSLMALGRPQEAIAPLQSALRGGWDGSNLYVTRTDLHEALAEAFLAAGRADSAGAHYAVVERAWRRADPPFAARYQVAREYLARHGVPRP